MKKGNEYEENRRNSDINNKRRKMERNGRNAEENEE